jgi:saccharopine dehydrogenase-like NADP-dependent oxidoreductase
MIVLKTIVKTLIRVEMMWRNGFGVGIFSAIESVIVGRLLLMMASSNHSNKYILLTVVTSQILHFASNYKPNYSVISNCGVLVTYEM